MQWLYLELLIYIHPFWVFLSTVNFVAWPPWLSPDSRCSHFLVKAYWLWTSSVNSQVDGMKIWFSTIFSFSVCSGVPSDCFRVGNCLLETSCGIHWGGRNAVAFPAVSLMLFHLHKTIFELQISNEAFEWCMLIQHKWAFFYGTINF